MKKILCVLIFALCVTSCAVYRADWGIGLKSVETPNSDTPGIKSASVEATAAGSYVYEDEVIRIEWVITTSEFAFSLENKSGRSLRLDWDGMSYVDAGGNVGRLLHTGMRYVEPNAVQPATTIPRGASLSDVLVPANNVYRGPGGFGWEWKHGPLVPSKFKNRKSFDAAMDKYVGRELVIAMPIEVDGQALEYDFRFEILMSEEKPLSTTSYFRWENPKR